MRDYEFLEKLIESLPEYTFNVVSHKFKPTKNLKNLNLYAGDWSKNTYSDKFLKDLYHNNRLTILPIKNTYQPSGQSVTLQSMAVGTPVLITKTEGFWDKNNFIDKKNIFFVEKNEIEIWEKSIKSSLNNKNYQKIIDEGVDLINKESEEEVKVTKYHIVLKDTYELVICDTPEEEKKAVAVDKILNRRENKKEKVKEYEVRWKEQKTDGTMWVSRDILLKMGEIKLVQRHDEKEAVKAGLASKTLTQKDIEKHFNNFGIDPEQATHTLIKSLSGGQKVKVVLAASLWQNPHLVILDEPTNYLDRDGLGALTNAIHEFKGGVVIISHNREFTNAVTQEKWIMEKGRLRREGESIAKEEESGNGNTEVANETTFDAMGNEIKIEREKILTDKEKKRYKYILLYK